MSGHVTDEVKGCGNNSIRAHQCDQWSDSIRSATGCDQNGRLGCRTNRLRQSSLRSTVDVKPSVAVSTLDVTVRRNVSVLVQRSTATGALIADLFCSRVIRLLRQLRAQLVGHLLEPIRVTGLSGDQRPSDDHEKQRNKAAEDPEETTEEIQTPRMAPTRERSAMSARFPAGRFQSHGPKTSYSPVSSHSLISGTVKSLIGSPIPDP